jgi:two-component system OmpR family response regulator
VAVALLYEWPVKKRLLIVDDEDSILFAMARYLTRGGFAVDCARELEEAEALATCTSYDAVIADLSLREDGSTEGLEIIRFIHQQSPAARVIILTAQMSPVLERESLRRGAHAFLHKPIPLPELTRLVIELTEVEA